MINDEIVILNRGGYNEKNIAIFLTIIMMTTLFISIPTLTYAASNDYTTWKQYDSAWGYETLWPNAQYKNMAGGGCWITSVSMLLRHYNVVTDSNVNTFNPLICCKRLIAYGIINSNGDFTNLGSLSKAYSGFSYVGTKSYSIEALRNLYNQGYACIVHETKGHYVAVKSVSGNNVVVMDPGSNLTTLTASDQIQYFKVSGVINNATAVSTLQISNATPITSIKQGSTWSCNGTISSNYTLTDVTARISSSSGETMYVKSVKPNTTSYNLKNSAIDAAMLFNKLPAGTYTYAVTAVDSSGKWISNGGQQFTVTELTSKNDIIEREDVHFEKQNNYTQGQFTDVPASQWFTDNVANAVKFGLMKGNSATTFNPYGDVTIAEAVTMASRIHSIYNTGAENFNAASGKWYQVYLDYAYNNGIISSSIYNSDVTKKATRAQFAEIFANALPDKALSTINNISDNAIPDVKITDSCGAYVYKLYRAGILAGGNVKGTFSPLTYITRAECATIVSRMADSDNRMNFSLL